MDNRTAADWLLFYDEYKIAYLELVDDAIHGTRPSLAEQTPGKKNSISDPTAKAGMLLTKHNYAEWLALIEEVERRLPWKMQIFLRLRREHRHAAGNQGWVAAVQWGYASAVAERLGKEPEDVWIESRKTFYTWWQRIIDYTVRLASKRGLL